MKSLILFFLIFFSSCANIVPPNGGEIDTTAPMLLYSVPNNKEINFKESKMEFVFDEKIVDSDFEQNFLISPPLLNNSSHSIKGNKLVVQLESSLEENTTYSISLSKTIKDLNEGNEIQNLSLCFSTGKQIDSLTLKGKVIDILYNQALNNAYVALYIVDKNKPLPNLKSENPNYITKTDSKGNFYFKNLKKYYYYIYAFDDIDLNGSYNLIDEKVGFIDSMIYTGQNEILVNAFSLNFIKDTIYIPAMDSSSSFGNLIIDSIPSNYFAELLQSNKVIFKGKGPKLIVDSIPSGKYQARIIEDLNNNNVWDKGSLENFDQAEKIIYYTEEIQIRANWDLELKWKSKSF